MGKSTLVTQLAEKINVSNILQTTAVKSVMDNFGRELADEESPSRVVEEQDQSQETEGPNSIAGVQDEGSKDEILEGSKTNEPTSPKEIVSAFKRECRRVRDGCNFDI